MCSGTFSFRKCQMRYLTDNELHTLRACKSHRVVNKKSKKKIMRRSIINHKYDNLISI